MTSRIGAWLYCTVVADECQTRLTDCAQSCYAPSNRFIQQFTEGKGSVSKAEAPDVQRVFEPTARHYAAILIEVLERKDPYTRGHSERVRSYVKMLVAELGWDDYLAQCAEVSAQLHDIGKLIVERSTIVNANPHLTPQQHAELFDHPYHGAVIIRAHFPDEVMFGILQHHERMDGKTHGVMYPAYPFGIPGEQIHPIAKCIAIADTFDAMTTQRSYNIPRSRDEAASMLLQGAGTRHDEELLRVFVERVIPRIVVTNTLPFPGM